MHNNQNEASTFFSKYFIYLTWVPQMIYLVQRGEAHTPSTQAVPLFNHISCLFGPMIKIRWTSGNQD